MKTKLEERFEVKATMVGRNAADGEQPEARILNRVIRVTESGSAYEAAQRHADLTVCETGAEKMSGLSHPGGDKKGIEEEDKSSELQGAAATRFGAVAARANCLAADRSDIEYAV